MKVTQKRAEGRFIIDIALKVILLWHRRPQDFSRCECLRSLQFQRGYLEERIFDDQT